MLTRLRAALFAMLSLSAPALAQSQFPQTMPASTVYGRLGLGAGPGQAIPFNIFAQNVGALLPLPSGQLLIGNGSGIAAPVPLTGVISVANTGVTSFTGGVINGTTIGNVTPAPGTFTNLIGTTSVFAADHSNAVGLSNGAYFVKIGGEAGSNLVFDFQSIQARNNGASNNLFINPFGGVVKVGNGTPTTITATSELAILADGSLGSPIVLAVPSVGISRYEARVGSGFSGSVPALWVEIIANNTGTGNPNSNAIIAQATQNGIGDIVALVGQSTQNTTGFTAYGTFGNATATVVGARAYGAEFDSTNSTGADVSYTNLSPYPAIVGVHVQPLGSKLNTVGVWIGNVDTSKQYDVGIAFTTGVVKTASIQDDSSSVTILKATGTHTSGIDFSGATLTDFLKGPSSFRVSGTAQIFGSALVLAGSGSGTVTQFAQATAGTPTITWGTSSGTPAVTASGPLAIATATGNITCATCATTAGASIPAVATGDLLYGSATNVLSALADVATGNVLISGGVLTAPSWGKVTSSALNITTTTCTNQFLTAISAAGTATCTTDTLASAQHANQGTTTTVLHGNASGNPSWAAVSLTADVTNTLPVANGGTGITAFGTGVATALGINVGSAGAFVTFNGALGSPSSAGTIPAFTLGGTIAGGGNQINNVIIGTTTPLAGFFTTLSATTSLTSPLNIGGSGTAGTQLTFQTTSGNGTTDQFAFVGGNNGATTFGLWSSAQFNLGFNGVAPLTGWGAGFGGLSVVNNQAAMALFVNTTSPGAASGAGMLSYVQALPTGADNRLGFLVFGSLNGTTGSTVDNAVSFEAFSSAAWTQGTSQPAYGVIKTTASSTAARVEIMRFQASGGVSIGTTTDPGIGSLQLNAQMFMPNITTSSLAQTGTVCWTTGTGKFTVDTTTTCLLSIGAAKNIISRPTPMDALGIVAQLEPVSFRYKDGFGDSGKYEQFGLIAEQVASVDERLAGRDTVGKLSGVRYQELTAVLVGAIQKLRADNDNFRAANDNFEARLSRLEAASK